MVFLFLIDTVNHVKRGDLLATLIPADDGKPGIDVCGNLIKQQKVNHTGSICE